MSTPYVWANYLADDSITFRPPQERDASVAGRWHESAVPRSRDQVLEQLKTSETIPWGNNPNIRLIIGERQTGETVGGVLVKRREHIVESIAIIPARHLPMERQRDIAVRTLRILTPWLFDEIGVLSARTYLPADHDHLITAATELGYVLNATYRESLLRPQGYIDVLMFQRVNPEWVLTRHQEPAGHV